MNKIIRSEIALGIVAIVAIIIVVILLPMINNQYQPIAQLPVQEKKESLNSDQSQANINKDIQILNAQLDLMDYNLVEPLTEFTRKIDHWDTYSNDEFKFSVKYPNTFLAIPGKFGDGKVASFLEFDPKARSLYGTPNPGFFSRISVYYWKDINNDYLKGGSWPGERKYKNLEDLFSDTDGPSVKKTGESVIDGKKAYSVSISGESTIEGIMFQYNEGYYRIEFPSAQRALDDSIKKQFISSFRLR